MKRRILIGIPPTRHVILGLDELSGLEELGYSCRQIPYSRNKWNISTINRVYGVMLNAFKVLIQLYKQKPDILYLNSRLDVNGSLRDAFSVLNSNQIARFRFKCFRKKGFCFQKFCSPYFDFKSRCLVVFITR